MGAAVPAGSAPAVLLRYPGACGARDYFNETIQKIAPANETFCHLTTELIPYIRSGARRFGVFVLFNPTGHYPLVRLSGDNPVYLTENRPMQRSQEYQWIPARLVSDLMGEKAPRTTAELLERHGDEIRLAEIDTRMELERYFEEVNAVIRSDIALPAERWHEVPESERRMILNRIGANTPWTPQAARRLELERHV